MGEVWSLFRWQLSTPSWTSACSWNHPLWEMTDYRERKTNVSQSKGGGLKRQDWLFCIFSIFIMFSRRNRERERNKERKSKDRDKSVAISYNFKLIKELVVRWWGHLHVQVLTEQEHYGGNCWKKDLKGALINVSAGVEGTLRRS